MLKKILLLSLGLLILSCTARIKNKKVIRYMNPEGSVNQLNIMKLICSRYEKQNPDTRIELMTGVKTDKILSTIASGSGLDVFFGFINIKDLISKKAVIPLDPFMEKYGFERNDYFPLAIDSLTWENKMYGLPVQTSVNAIAYNKTLLEQHGLPLPPQKWSFDEFYNYLSLLYKNQLNAEKQNKIYPINAFPFRDIFYGTVYRYMDMKTGIINKQARQILIKNFKKYQEILKLYPRSAELSQISGGGVGGSTAIFRMQRSFLLECGAWMLPDLKEINSFDWDIVYLPEDESIDYCAATAYLSITSISRLAEDAYKFIHYYASGFAADRFAAGKNGMSSRMEATEHFFTPPPKNIGVFINSAKKARVPIRLMLTGENEFFEKMQSSILDDFNYGRITPEKFTDELLKIADACLKNEDN